MQRLWVPGRFPGMNEILEARMQSSSKGNTKGKRWNAYSDMKQQWGHLVSLLAGAQRFTPVQSGFFTFLVREPNEKRDPDNLAYGAIKIMLDALKSGHFLANDGQKNVLGFVPYWIIDRASQGVTLFVHDEKLLSKAEAIELDDRARSKT
jgi:hypothetical protein